ncbi:uncharacterized protein LOC115756223 [Rhodamnia argentea]|uniref:Uncharacterized protein LOC115756223 n=1 Tax=Rhodamnia argentea TaxID=178133 RepID=A0A8B8QX28_9MYRT|nr:uncharacterized protein LOC115756223 [Rhodamnia argentea]
MASHKDTVIAKWTDQLTQLFYNKRTRQKYTLARFKNKTFKPKDEYGSFKKLISQSGFGWDNINKKVVVENDTVWGSHIKANPKWAKFRNEWLPLYHHLCILFEDTYATGEYTTGNVQEFVSSNDGDNGAFGENDGGKELGGRDPQVGEGSGNECQTGDGFDNEQTATPTCEKHKLDRTPNSKRRRKSVAYDFASICKVIQEAVKMKMSQSSHTSVTSHAPQPVDPYSMGAMITILKGMPDMDPSLYTKAMNHAYLNAAWREAFVLTEPGWRLALFNSI